MKLNQSTNSINQSINQYFAYFGSNINQTIEDNCKQSQVNDKARCRIQKMYNLPSQQLRCSRKGAKPAEN